MSAAGVTVTAPTSWATVMLAVPDAEPAAAVTVAAPLPAAVTSPAALTVATEVARLGPRDGRPRHYLSVLVPYFGRQLHGGPEWP